MATPSPTRSRTPSPQHGPSTTVPSNRGGAAASSSIFVAGGFQDAANASPTLSSVSSGSNALVPAGRVNLGVAHPRKIVIRVDHSIATCFDPADKELYDLWAPKT
ncbi:hypothetical protein BJV74DRAFT_806366 [Russula compacta]|nr:hypothetical protein BJV74DRAFT_806366 [Russula compacta]